MKRFLHRVIPAVLVFTALPVLVFAQNGGKKLFKTPGYAETRPDISNRGELTAVFSGEDLELDFRKSYLASEAQIFTALYEGLFSYHPYTLEPVPAAASSWRLSDDKKTWTFSIRANARFSNGDPLRAEDFRRSWISLLDPARNSPYSSLYDIIEGAQDYRLGKLTDPSKVGIIAEGEKTLVVRLNAPASFFPSMLCHHSFSPIHPSLVNSGSWSAPLANGPFKIESNNGNSVTLVKNTYYWDISRVTLNKIIIRFTDDDNESAAMWNSGEARWISGVVNLEALTDRSGIVVNPMFATHYYYIRSGETPWNDNRVRRALALSLPWESVREGHYLPARTLIYRMPGYPELTAVETNLEEARRLLAEAGYPRGVGLPELVIRITPSEDADRIAKLMAAAWMGLGLQVKLDVVPYNRYFQALKGNDYEVGSTTWIGDFADPYTFLQMWRRDSNLNDADYDDSDYEQLMDRSMIEEGDKRYATMGEAEQLLLDRGTVLPISYTPALNVVDTDEIDGWFPNALDIHPFKYFRFKTLKPLPGVALAVSPR